MLNRWRLLLLGVLLLALLGARERPQAAAALPRPPVLNRYELDVTYDPAAMTIGGTERLLFTNTRDVALAELWFHLYPNAPFFQSSPRPDRPLARPGSLVVQAVQVDGQAVQPDADSFHLRVPLPRAVAPADTATLDFAFVTTLPSLDDRFGVSGSVANVTSWYPILAVYDEAGWHRDAYLALGDPFYSEVAAYRLRVRTPTGFTVAGTGSLTERLQEDDGVSWSYRAEPVREVALAISDRFRVRQRDVLGTVIRDYAAEGTSDELAEQALNAAATALRYYTEWFGPFPYRDLALVHSDDGMEYPQLVFVSENVDRRVQPGPDHEAAVRRLNEVLVIHEVAHQWWYGVVGNDELHDLWDESLARYAELLYYERSYGRERYEQRLADAARSYLRSSRVPAGQMCTGCDLYYYSDRPAAYGPGIYDKGAVMFHTLRAQVGDAAFFAFLQTFYQRYQFATATWQDLIATASEVTGRDLAAFFADWLAPGGGASATAAPGGGCGAQAATFDETVAFTCAY